ncbi:MAG TPA: hypothetical protein VN887_16425 [Candidatus Angelobacter sp.]|nr:hypothetical protein [Candidatus Angelobacter sp.]
MQKPIDPYLCIRFCLKLEIMLPFVFFDGGGGTSDAFGQSLFAAVVVAVLNNWFEHRLCTVEHLNKRFLLSATFTPLVLVTYSGLLIWWKTHEMLRNPIAYYGIVRTLLVTGILVIGWRTAALAADDSSARNRNRRLEAAQE